MVELLIEGRFHGRQFGGLACHLANLCVIAYGSDPCKPATIHHHRRAQHHIGGVSGLFFGHFGRCMLVDDGFARERRLVDLQARRLQQQSVGRYFVAHFNHHQVARHHVFARHGGGLSVSAHLYELLFAQGSEHVEFLCGISFKIKADGGG